jgi:hypothetical protein
VELVIQTKIIVLHKLLLNLIYLFNSLVIFEKFDKLFFNLAYLINGWKTANYPFKDATLPKDYCGVEETDRIMKEIDKIEI